MHTYIYIHTYIHTYIIYIYVYIQPTCHLGNKVGSEAAIRAPLSMRRRGSGGWGAARCHTRQVGCTLHRPLLLPTGVAPLEVAALLEGGVAEEVERGVPPLSISRSTRATRLRRRMRRPLIKRHSGVRCRVQWPPRRIALRGCSIFYFYPEISKRAAGFGTPWYLQSLPTSCEDGFEEFCALLRHSVKVFDVQV